MSETKICIKCSRQFEISDLEKDIRKKANAPLPDKCHFCRLKTRYNKLPMYGFRKVKCHYCGAEIVTSVPDTEGRPIACNKCYREKFLTEIN